MLHAVPQRGEPLASQGMELARTIISNRLQTLGVASPTVSIRGNDEIVIHFAGTDVPKNVTQIASVTGNLQFFDLESDLAVPTITNGNPTPYPSLYSLLSTPGVGVSNGQPEAFYLFGPGPSHRVLQGPAGTYKGLLAPYGGKPPKGATVFTVPANREVVYGTTADFTAATKPVRRSPDGTYWYLFKLPPAITGRDIHESAVAAGTDPNIGIPQVTVGLTKQGSKGFQAITKAEYARGQRVAGLHGSAGRLDQRYVQHSAIVLDGKLYATPYIDYTDAALSLGISTNAAVISNLGSMAAARRVALVVQSGSLPYRFRVVSSTSCPR